MNQPSDPEGEPGNRPTAPGDQSAEDAERSAGPSWTAYAQPMRSVDDATDRQLHPRFWEGQLEAARRGSLAWGFLAFFLGYGGYYLINLILTALGTGSDGFNPSRPPDTGPVVLLAFAPNIVLGLLPVLFSYWKGNGPRSDFGIVPKRRDIKVGLACGGLGLLVSYPLSLVLISIYGEPPSSGVTELMQGERNVWLLLIALFLFLGAPLTEELLMRGALWGALEHYKIPRYAILVLTALVFALIHGEMWRLPVLFVSGVALGMARMITGRVGSSMIAHATNNFLPSLVFFFAAG